MSTIYVKGATLREGDTIWPGTTNEQTICYFRDEVQENLWESPMGARVAVTDKDKYLIDNGQDYEVAA